MRVSFSFEPGLPTGSQRPPRPSFPLLAPAGTPGVALDEERPNPSDPRQELARCVGDRIGVGRHLEVAKPTA